MRSYKHKLYVSIDYSPWFLEIETDSIFELIKAICNNRKTIGNMLQNCKGNNMEELRTKIQSMLDYHRGSLAMAEVVGAEDLVKYEQGWISALETVLTTIKDK